MKPFTLVVTATIASGIAVSASAQCALLPQYTEHITLLGHQTWNSNGLRMFPADKGAAYAVDTGYRVVGGKVDEAGCVTYPDGQTAVQVDSDQFMTEPIRFNTDRFQAHLVYPKSLPSPDVTLMRQTIQAVADRVSRIYPLGFAPSNKQDFYILSTAGLAGDAYLNTQRIKAPAGTNLAVLALPPRHPDFEAEVIRAMVDVYTVSRPHPLMGPKERSNKRDRKIDFGKTLYTLNVADYDALVASWATVALESNKDRRLERLYNTLVDYAGYIDTSKRTEAQDLTLSHIQNDKFAETWKNLDAASPEDAYFYRYNASLVDAMRLTGEALSADEDIKEIFTDINKGEALSLAGKLGEDAVKRAMEGYRATDADMLQSQSITRTAVFGQEVFDAAQKAGYLDVPPLPESEEVFSRGAHLDTRLYQQSQDKLADKVFLLTTFQPSGFANGSVQSLGYILGNTVRALLTKGDVLVVARANEGLTRDALRDSLMSCSANEFSWSMRKAAIHMQDTVSWLRWRGYKHVEAVGFGKGALALVADADDKNLEKIYAFNPWRASEDAQLKPYDTWRGLDYIATRYLVPGVPSKQCGEDAILKALESLVQPADRAKITALSGANMMAHLKQYEGWTRRYNAIFGKNIIYPVGKWNYPWAEPAFYPDEWIDKVD
ncbi:MAG: hypothetical protein GC134_04250 [Proteobacteria bacterium]|nr:hypothetical protein [Pseudomonadota bacterium]